jgi:hypothetical protein
VSDTRPYSESVMGQGQTPRPTTPQDVVMRSTRPYSESVMGQGQTPRPVTTTVRPAVNYDGWGETPVSPGAWTGTGMTTRLPGGVAYMGPTSGPGPGASIAELEGWIRSNYGYMAGFLNIPEVRDVLLNAARNGWDAGRLYGAISQTSWWRNTSSSARQWAQLLSEDPAEARRMVQEYSASISDAARSYGLSLSADQIARLATTSAQMGWTPEEQIDNILKNVNWSTLEGGTLTSLRDRMKMIAGEYLVGISDDTAQNYAVRIARGELTEQGVASIMQSQAKARFGYMAPQIDAGVTPSMFFAPARDMVATTLEVNPEQISLMEPRWLSLLEKRDDKGQLMPATLNDAMLAARRQPEWMDTKNATELMANFGTQLQQAFGR